MNHIKWLGSQRIPENSLGMAAIKRIGIETMSAMSTKNQRAQIVRNSAIKLSTVALLALAILSSGTQASAQGGFSSTSQAARKGLGDGSSFYMSRRQLQFVDDSPIIRNSNGQVQSGGAATGFASQQGGQQPLQRAGFTSYSSSLPSSTGAALPKVNNGVPVQTPPPAPPKSLSAKAGGLGKGKKSTAKPTAAPKAPAQPEGIHAYNSYKGYNPSALAPGEMAGGGAGTVTTRQSNVKGSMLNWSRRRRSQ